MNDKRDEVMESRGQAYAEMEAHADAFLAEIVDSADVDTNILLTLFGLSRETELRRQIADDLASVVHEHYPIGICGLCDYIDKLRGNK